jgi:hypothetical protein
MDEGISTDAEDAMALREERNIKKHSEERTRRKEKSAPQ